MDTQRRILNQRMINLMFPASRVIKAIKAIRVTVQVLLKVRGPIKTRMTAV